VRRYQATVYDSNRWDGFELRPGDIIISTPPKCGTTWTQMICALLILQEPELPRPLDTLSPWIDMVTRSRTEVYEGGPLPAGSDDRDAGPVLHRGW
jgi:aryl sulfotransferase